MYIGGLKFVNTIINQFCKQFGLNCDNMLNVQIMLTLKLCTYKRVYHYNFLFCKQELTFETLTKHLYGYIITIIFVWFKIVWAALDIMVDHRVLKLEECTKERGSKIVLGLGVKLALEILIYKFKVHYKSNISNHIKHKQWSLNKKIVFVIWKQFSCGVKILLIIQLINYNVLKKIKCLLIYTNILHLFSSKVNFGYLLLVLTSIDIVYLRLYYQLFLNF
ncbi:hypothetical protein AGLY_004663, partial [Aphis glycines]